MMIAKKNNINVNSIIPAPHRESSLCRTKLTLFPVQPINQSKEHHQ
jgi:hypothetical protein